MADGYGEHGGAGTSDYDGGAAGAYDGGASFADSGYGTMDDAADYGGQSSLAGPDMVAYGGGGGGLDAYGGGDAFGATAIRRSSLIAQAVASISRSWASPVTSARLVVRRRCSAGADRRRRSVRPAEQLRQRRRRRLVIPQHVLLTEQVA